MLGTIGIIDRLLDGNYIEKDEYEFCLLKLQKHNGQEVRLPGSEISARLQRLKRKSNIAEVLKNFFIHSELHILR